MTTQYTNENDRADEKGRTPVSTEKDHGHRQGPNLEPGETGQKGVNPDSPLADPDAK